MLDMVTCIFASLAVQPFSEQQKHLSMHLSGPRPILMAAADNMKNSIGPKKRSEKSIEI